MSIKLGPGTSFALLKGLSYTELSERRNACLGRGACRITDMTEIQALKEIQIDEPMPTPSMIYFYAIPPIILPFDGTWDGSATIHCTSKSPLLLLYFSDLGTYADSGRKRVLPQSPLL